MLLTKDGAHENEIDRENQNRHENALAHSNRQCMPVNIAIDEQTPDEQPKVRHCQVRLRLSGKCPGCPFGKNFLVTYPGKGDIFFKYRCFKDSLGVGIAPAKINMMFNFLRMHISAAFTNSNTPLKINKLPTMAIFSFSFGFF